MSTMTPRPNISEVATQTGEAWSKHYRRDHDGAVNQFRDIVGRYPEDIDANYGLSMALAGAERRSEADAAFRATKALVERMVQTDTEDFARFLMLNRMIDQHLARLNG